MYSCINKMHAFNSVYLPKKDLENYNKEVLQTVVS